MNAYKHHTKHLLLIDNAQANSSKEPSYLMDNIQ